jgi:hypothetical protein
MVKRTWSKTSKMTHLINQLKIEAICGDESQAFEARFQLSGICSNRLPALIEEVCSKYVREEEWVLIDRLEIDLGKIPIGALENMLPAVLAARFEKALRTKLQSLPGNRTVIARQLSYYEMLVFFLKNGVLPWWAEASNPDLNEVCTDVLEKHETAFINFLLENRSNKNLWQRIACQFNNEVRSKIISLLPQLIDAGKKVMQWHDLLRAKGYILSASPETIKLLSIVTKFILRYAPVFLDHDTRAVAQINNELLEELVSAIYPGYETGRQLIAGTFEETQVIQATQIPGSDSHKIFIKNGIPERPAFSIPASEEEISREVAVEKLMLRHAGIVLLAPFLKSLFSALGYLEGNKWKSIALQQRAIHTLHYISTGNQMVPEYGLALEKLLCGVSISAPVEREIELAAAETKEAEELLHSVIAHWKALRNTSINGLREAFLKRDGILEKKEADWSLCMERKTADVLLESLPWGYSMISLPWNWYFLYVDW